jgi:putative CocE/NonD family hydrolase
MKATEVVIERDVMVVMRDGVRLSTDLYRRASGEALPVLLLRTPYGKQDVFLVKSTLFDPIAAVERGFAVVVQDCRGTGVSEGELDTVFPERSDGHDTIDWIAASSWCDGNVGIYGASFMGITALQAIVDAPPALKACIAYICPANFRDNYWYSGGAFELGAWLIWSMNDVARRRGRLADQIEAGELAKIDAALAAYRADPDAFFSASFDPRVLPGPCGAVMPFYERNLSHPYDDEEYWGKIDVVAAADRVTAHVMYIAGWYDICIQSGIDLYRALRKRSSEEVRDAHALIVGPWAHESYLGRTTLSRSGVRNFGPVAASGQVALQSVALAWFERWLKGGEEGYPGVRYFHIGPNRWEEAAEWPPRPVSEQRWYLHGGGHARSRSGDGVLEREQPAAQAPDSYIYDPGDPAPTHGGRHILFALPSGVQDQRVVEDRSDVLVYTSAALVEPITVLGNIRVELHVSSSAPTTDFFVVLADVHPDGTAENVAEGMLRLPADGDIPQDKVRTAAIDLQDAAYTFPIGHGLRLHITSSCFPRFDRNRNVIPDKEPREATALAVQQVHHSAAHPSVLVLQCAQSSSVLGP